MKIYFFILVLFASFQDLISQDNEPDQNQTSPPPQTKFMLGWHWGASKSFSSSLGANQIDKLSAHFHSQNRNIY